MKFYLKKYRILFLGLLIVSVISCDNTLTNENENPDYRIRHRDFDFIKDNDALIEKLSSFSESGSPSKHSTTSKSIKFGSEDDEFTIFTDRVTEVASLDGQDYSYTFYIKSKTRGEFNTIENLILTSKGDGSYKAHIAKYYFPEGVTSENDNFEIRDFREITGSELPNLFGKSSNSSNIMCTNVQYVIYEILHDCYSGNHSGANEANQCDGNGSLPYSTFTIYYVCGPGGGGGSSGGGNTGGPNTGGTISNPPPTGDNVANTGITLPPSCQTNNCEDDSAIVNEINSLLNNELTTDELIYLFNNKVLADEIHASILNKTLVTAFPLVKYPLGSKYSKLYPKLTEYLKNQLPKIADNQFIVDKLVLYGDLNETQVKNRLKWGQGPTIEIVQLGVDSNGNELHAKFNGNNPDTIFLDIDLVNDLENSNDGSEYADGLTFLVGVSVLHEFVHYSEYTDETWNSPESGNLFEIATYGQIIFRDNAEIVLKNY